MAKKFNFNIKSHSEIGSNLNLMDFDIATKTSGSRFVFLKGNLAALERAISNFMLDIHVHKHGYTEIQPASIVHSRALLGTGQLPKFSDDLFTAGENHWLIPTEYFLITSKIKSDFPPKNISLSSFVKSNFSTTYELSLIHI